eukprot:gb/GECG01015370.1/.p1 GENE.gb/GECG01015370.1/~~gb/GECG01015370.1/.p1  ORF type:complete len:1055 (+),score=139.04 gb/GECG01015370.1/:1-3165(+)
MNHSSESANGTSAGQGCTLSFRGVCLDSENKFRAVLKVFVDDTWKLYHDGPFDSPLDAAKSYDSLARKYLSAISDDATLIVNYPVHEHEERFDPWNRAHATGQEMFVANQQDNGFFPDTQPATHPNESNGSEPLEELPVPPYSRSEIKAWSSQIPYIHGTFAGVVHSGTNSFNAVLQCEGERKVTRAFTSPNEAAQAYDDLARMFGPKQCRLNFPGPDEPAHICLPLNKRVKYQLDQERKRRQALSLLQTGERQVEDFTEEVTKEPFTISPYSKSAVHYNSEIVIMQKQRQIKENLGESEGAVVDMLRTLDKMTPKSQTIRKLFTCYGDLYAYPFRQTVRYKANSALLREGECIIDPREGNEHFSVCCSCGRGGSLILCDRCPAAFHQECAADTEAHGVPADDRDWVCPICQMGDGLMACTLENLLGIGGLTPDRVATRFPVMGESIAVDGFGVIASDSEESGGKARYVEYAEENGGVDSSQPNFLDLHVTALGSAIRHKLPSDSLTSLDKFLQKQTQMPLKLLANLRCRSVFTVSKDVAKERLLNAWSRVNEECCSLLEKKNLSSLQESFFGNTFDQRFHDGTAIGGPYRGIMMKQKQQNNLEELSMKRLQKCIAELAYESLSRVGTALGTLKQTCEEISQDETAPDEDNGLPESLRRKLAPEKCCPEVAVTDESSNTFCWAWHPGLSVRLCSSLLQVILESGARWYLPSDIQVNREGFATPFIAALAANVATIRMKGSALPHQLNYLPGVGTGFVGVMPPFGYGQLAAVNAETVRLIQSDRLKSFRDSLDPNRRKPPVEQQYDKSAGSGETSLPASVVSDVESDDEISALHKFKVCYDDPFRTRLTDTAALYLMVGAAEYALEEQPDGFSRECEVDSCEYIRKHCEECQQLNVSDFGCASDFLDHHWEAHVPQGSVAFEEDTVDWDSDDSSECVHDGLDSSLEKEWLDYAEEHCDFRQDDVILNWMKVCHTVKESVPVDKRKRAVDMQTLANYHYARVRQEFISAFSENEDAIAPLVAGGVDIGPYFMGNSSGQFVNNLSNKKTRKRGRSDY